MKGERGYSRVAALGSAGLALWLGLFACREREPAAAAVAGAPPAAHVQERGAALLQVAPRAPVLQVAPRARAGEGGGAARGAEASEPPRRPPPDVRQLPPDRPWQHLAFTDERLAQLSEQQLVVRVLPQLRVAARISVPGARNVVAGVGGDFVAAGSEHVYRLARLDTRAELLAPVPRLGPTVIVPGADSSDHFWLLYEGIPRVPEFDLQETVLTPYVSVLSWTELAGLDGRAVASPGDGTFLYTTARGLRRVDAEGGVKELVVPDLGSDIWWLLSERDGGGLWVATRSHVEYLAQVGVAGPAPRRLARLELPPHSVALAARGRELAVLAVEAIDLQRARLRVDVYSRDEPSGTEPGGFVLRRSLHQEQRSPTAPSSPDAGPAPLAPFAPELALAPGRPWVAFNGFELAVFDWRSGRRLLPPEEAAAQKLAPASP